MKVESMYKILLSLQVGFILLVGGCGDQYQSRNYGKYTRAELRYYAYAPPFIPHQVKNPECLDCHKDGLIVEGFKAPVTPHAEFLNCQQCHIKVGKGKNLFKQNRFAGVQEPKRLRKPQPAGPPLIPHRTFMREKCLVCHSDVSRSEVIQTTHPERLNCLQCHVEQDSEVVLFRKNTF